MLGEKYTGYYGYDTKGERAYKLTGTSGISSKKHSNRELAKVRGLINSPAPVA